VRRLSVIPAIALLANLLVSPVFAQAQPSSPEISGVVDDQANGLPLSGVNVEAVGPKQKSAVTDSSGRFTISDLTPGLYQLRIAHAGYQTTISDTVALISGQNASVTLAIARQQTGATTLREIGRTSVRSSQSLQRSSVIYHSASVESIERYGYFRTGDYLRTLPQVNIATSSGGGSDTPSPGDDQYLDFRGIGNIETTSLLDGHPIGAGLNRGKNYGYNWEISPTFALRNVVVTYGSGLSGLTPYSAIGGVADMQTLEPTPDRQFNFTQGFGSYSKLVTNFSATGQLNAHLGYAIAAGTQGIDGPYHNLHLFQPGAAYDQAAPVGSSTYNMGVYKDDTAVSNRGALAKFRYSMGDPAHPSHLTASGLWGSYWDDKTGNGDQDFLPYDTALTNGQGQLAGYTPPGPAVPPYTVANLPSCPSGTFLAKSVNGNPFGFGPNGLEDGGPHCVTPQQYAQFASGLQGAGTTWQAFRLNQYDLRFDRPTPKGQVVVDGYTNNWFQIYDRTFQLPNNAATDTSGTGFGPNPYITSPAVSTSGFSVTDEFNSKNNDFGIGFAYNNYAYALQTLGAPASNPVVNDQYYYLQDVFHPQSAKYSLYLNAASVKSTVTNTWGFNPRLALVYNLSRDNVLRLATGSAQVQPFAAQVFTPASLVAPGALLGTINCAGLTIIGQVGNPALLPEHANDVDVSLGHRFGGDSQIQATVYSENVNRKIFAEPINTNTLPAGFINTAPYQTVVSSQCPPGPGSGQLGVNSLSNVGRLLAQGVDIQGRARLNRRLFFDYDYSIETSVLKAADTLLLQNNKTYIVGSQLPGVPMHKWQLSVDQTFGKNIDVRLTQYYLGNNNPKNSPAYNYGDLTVLVPVKTGSFNLAVNNVFNQHVQYLGLLGHGVPLALNSFASPSDYAPLVGAGATELYGLPPRQVYFSYTIHTKK